MKNSFLFCCECQDDIAVDWMHWRWQCVGSYIFYFPTPISGSKCDNCDAPGVTLLVIRSINEPTSGPHNRRTFLTTESTEDTEMMTKDEALQKIRKLLATTGRTKAEADTAQVLAAALAEKHGIDLEFVDQAEAERRSRLTDIEVDRWTQIPLEATCSAFICEEFFEVNYLSVGLLWQRALHFIGTEHHLAIAEHVFKFLVREFRWQWRHKRGRCKNRQQFVWGCYAGLVTKLRGRFAQPAVEGSKALEISWKARRDQYVKDKWGETTSRSVAPKSKRSAAIAAGYRAGKDIEIRPGVDAGAAGERAQIGEGQKLLGF